MAQFQPIQYDYILHGRPSAEDDARTAIRESPRRVPSRARNFVESGAVAGTKVKSSPRGGVFDPGPVSGMLHP